MSLFLAKSLYSRAKPALMLGAVLIRIADDNRFEQIPFSWQSPDAGNQKRLLTQPRRGTGFSFFRPPSEDHPLH
jgi:hypothetical protein